MKKKKKIFFFQIFLDDFLGQYTIPISSIERDNLLNKVCSLSPRIEHPEETYVQGEIVVSLVNEKIPASTKNDWIKRFMGDKFEPLKAKSESGNNFFFKKKEKFSIPIIL